MLHNICTLCWGMALALLSNFNLALAAPVGTVQTDFGGREGVMGTALQADGKLVAAGFFYGSSYDNSFALARYDTDGKLDTTFGTGGKVLTTTFAATSGYAAQAEATAVAIQADGKIVAAGFTYTEDIALARYNTNGSLDTSFGSGGKVVTNWGSLNDYAFAAGIQSTGKIIVGGYANTNGTFDFVMTRYNSNGTVDTTFGINGTVFTDFSLSDDRIAALKVITGDKIVAVGRSGGDMAVARYTVNGALDSTFGSGGKVTTDFGGNYDEARAVAIDANGKIVVTGPAGVNGDIGLVRYTAAGALDSKFGSSGKVTTNLGGSDQSAAVAIDGSGKIVVGGYAGNGFEVLRYTSGGALDSTFGTSGRVTTRIGAEPEQVWAITISGTQIIAGGRTQSSATGNNFALARYNSNGTLDANFGAKADLAITVVSSPNPVQLGGTITHTITVTNNGPDAAEQILISGGGAPIATLASGATVTVTQTATVEVGGSLSFTATVSSITADPVAANNSATTTTPINGAADLSITMTASPTLAKIDIPLTYTIRVTNNGPNPAARVKTTHSSPSGSAYVWFSSASTTQGTCVNTHFDGVSCDIGTMTSGVSVTITLVYTPKQNGSLTNTATVTGVGDPNTANNSATVNTTVNTATDLAVTITDSADPVKFGNNVTYTITVKNNGPDAAVNVPMRSSLTYQTTNLRPDVTLLSVSSAQGVCTLQNPPSGVTYGFYLANCDFSRIESGTSAIVTLVVNSNATGTLDLTAKLLADYFGNSGLIFTDPDQANNTATEFTTVTGAADLVMTVTPNKTSIVPGENLTYTITLINNGPDPALGAEVANYMPVGVDFVSVVSSQGTCGGGSFTPNPPNTTNGGVAGCDLGVINAGASVNITLVVKAFATGVLSNTIEALSNITDPTPADARRTISTTGTGTTDLAISMTASPNPVQVNNQLTYTITVRNNGPYPSLATVTSVPPSGLAYTYWSSGQGACNSPYYYPGNNAVNCELGVLNSGASATVTVSAVPSARGNVSNSASVVSGVMDSNTANNSASVTLSVTR